MRKRVLSMMLFGALVTASLSTFVSCKDYDDDISELRDDLATNATDLSSLVDEKMQSAQAELAALKSQATSLEDAYKKADEALAQTIANATNDANGYAELQAAQAQTEAIAAAQELVNSAVAKLETSISEANAIIAEHGETLQALLAADLTLQEGIEAAKARADEAYTLAEQASKAAGEASEAAEEAKKMAADVADDLKEISETLGSQISALEGKLDNAVKLAEENMAALEGRIEILEGAQADNAKALEALSAADDELRSLIEQSQADIEKLLAETYATKAEMGNVLIAAQEYTDKALEDVLAQISELQGLADDLNNAALAASVAATNAQNSATEVAKLAEQVQKDAAAAKEAAGKAEKAQEAAEIAQEAAEKAQNAAVTAQKAAEDAKDMAEKAAKDAKDALSLAQNAATKTQVSDMEKAYKAADTKLGERIDSLNNVLGTIKEDIRRINVLLTSINSSFNFNVNNLITSIIYQDATGYNVYAQVQKNNAVFAPNDVDKTQALFPYVSYPNVEKLTVGSYNTQVYAGELYVTVNPADIDASKVVFNLENSLGNKNSIYKLETAKPSEEHLITRASSRNGLWVIPVKSTSNIFRRDQNPAEGVEAKALYALVTEYKQDTINPEDSSVVTVNKKVYSHYAINKVPTKAVAANATELTVRGVGGNVDASPAAGVDVQFSSLTGTLALGTSGKRVYKTFVECTGVKNSEGKAVANGVSTVHAANSGILYTILPADDYGKENNYTLTCPENYKNYTITLKFYIWNYDGSVYSIEKNVVFNQTLWGLDVTTFTHIPSSANAQTLTSTEFPTFDFVKGVTCTNGTTWSQEAYSVQATVSNSDAAIKGATISLLNENRTTTYETVTVGAAKKNLDLANLNKIKQLRLTYDPSALKLDKTYHIYLTFFDRNGFKVNIVQIDLTMNVPTGIPSPWHIEAAFDSNDKLTIAWAEVDQNDPTVGVYRFRGSFYDIMSGYTETNPASPYSFKLENPSDYVVPTAIYARYNPTAIPAASDYVMSVPNAAINTAAGDEHVYSMVGGIMFYGLPNMISYDGQGGWNDHFDIKFLSPIRYSILGTADYIDRKTYVGMQWKSIVVNYRQSVTINNSRYTAYDPKEAADIFVNFFENCDSRIARTKIEFADPNNSNNALFSEIAPNGDGTYTLKTTDYVSMTDDANVDFKLTVTDVWGAVTTTKFTVTVKANQ